MSDTKKLVPVWTRILTAFLGLANTAFGVMGYVTANGVDLAQQFSARNTAIGLAILLVSVAGVPESIAITMLIRLLIEGQDLVLGVLKSGLTMGVLMPLGFMVVEAVIFVTMFRAANQKSHA
ncbi:MAG: hypothetical protein WCG80_08260 [Spirochaetales bacterium]